MEYVYWFYVLLIVVTAPPMVPNSALLAGAGALAAGGSLNLPLLVCVPLTSAVLGDLAVYRLGRRSSARVLAWTDRRSRRRSMLTWVAERMRRYGVASVIAVRFVPTGRGMGGLTAGVVGYPARKYLLGAGIAEAIFVSCTIGLGYVGGRLVTEGLAPLFIGPTVSVMIAATTLCLQRLAVRRRNITDR